MGKIRQPQSATRKRFDAPFRIGSSRQQAAVYMWNALSLQDADAFLPSWRCPVDVVAIDLARRGVAATMRKSQNEKNAVILMVVSFL